MTVRLRAHHLLCMLTYVGRGYSPAFTANYDRTIERLNAGEQILIVDGPDDICQPLIAEEATPHCLNGSVRERDQRAAGALTRWLGQPVEIGHLLTPDRKLLARMRTSFARGATRQACLGCEWISLCSSVAGNGYAESLLTLTASD